MELTIKTPANNSSVEVKDYSSMPELAAGTPLERLTRKEFWNTHSIVGMESKLNQSDSTTGNGVPFISFYTANGKCHNIYFSKNAGITLEEMDMEKGSVIPPTFFQEFRFMYSDTSEAGVQRWKIVSAKEGGNRVNDTFFND
jgi:hypothetical protein